MVGVAQQGEQLLCKRQVEGPNPSAHPTNLKFYDAIVKSGCPMHSLT
jgi:hypothetical protein